MLNEQNFEMLSRYFCNRSM